ncbi:hypothetical protein ACQKOD_02015, partial [Bacillus mycoides]|uniref:hypothetical protein n=1 Tax=Bacillus mycoides TaxID=1405 RepID=UPI003CFDE114
MSDEAGAFRWYPVPVASSSAFKCIQLQRLESPVISLSRSKQKALQGRELQCPAILSEPLALLVGIQLQRLESPVISLSRSKQKALQGRELQCPAI